MNAGQRIVALCPSSEDERPNLPAASRAVRSTHGCGRGTSSHRGIVEALAPEEVWLFGSRARQTHSVDSDWDLMAVLPDSASDRDLAQQRIAEPEATVAA